MKIYCPNENVSYLLFVAFWWKEVVFFSSFRQLKPIAVPRPVVLRQVQTLRVHTNDWAVACSVQQWVWSTLPVRSLSIAMQPAMRTWRRRLIPRACTRLCLGCAWLSQFFWPEACSTAVKVLYSTVATAELAVHKETESSGFGGNSIRQRAATFSLPDSVSKRAVVDKRSSLREDSVKRYVHDLSEEFAHPKINVLHLPQHFSQLEARNTDDDNAKQQKRKIEYSSIRSLSHVHQFRTRVQTGAGKASSPLDPEEPSLSSLKQTPFFHCTIAQLAAAHTFLMAEISGHALTDLSTQRWFKGC